MANVHISELFPVAGTHSQRPDEPTTEPSFYACSEHNKIYRWNGLVWSDWLSPDSGVTDHGALTGLTDDDHTQYHNNTRGDARYYQKSEVDTSLAAKADTDHEHDSDYAPLSHTHAISDVTNLQSTLDGKASTSHNHDGTYATAAHNHSAANITSGTLGIARLATSVPIIVDKAKNGGSWPGARPTADTTVTVIWIGDTDPGALAVNGDIWEEV